MVVAKGGAGGRWWAEAVGGGWVADFFISWICKQGQGVLPKADFETVVVSPVINLMIELLNLYQGDGPALSLGGLIERCAMVFF